MNCISSILQANMAEGYRSTPSLVWVPPAGGGVEEGEERDVPLFGRMAEARYYDVRDGTVVQPRSVILSSSSSEGNGKEVYGIVERAIRKVATNALDQQLGGCEGEVEDGKDVPLFV